MKTIFGETYYNTKETAELIGVTEQTVRKYKTDGLIKPTKIGRIDYFSVGDIKAFIGQK